MAKASDVLVKQVRPGEAAPLRSFLVAPQSTASTELLGLEKLPLSDICLRLAIVGFASLDHSTFDHLVLEDSSSYTMKTVKELSHHPVKTKVV